jgi:hypothetical protein
LRLLLTAHFWNGHHNARLTYFHRANGRFKDAAASVELLASFALQGGEPQKQVVMPAARTVEIVKANAIQTTGLARGLHFSVFPLQQMGIAKFSPTFFAPIHALAPLSDLPIGTAFAPAGPAQARQRLSNEQKWVELHRFDRLRAKRKVLYRFDTWRYPALDTCYEEESGDLSRRVVDGASSVDRQVDLALGNCLT